MSEHPGERRSPARRDRVLAIVCLLLATLTASVAPANAAYWKRIWGGPVKLSLANDAGQYAVKLPEEDIYERREDAPADEPEWVKIGGPGKEFAVTDDKLYGLAPDGGAVYEYSGTPGHWTQVGGAAGHIYAGSSGLFATDPTTGDLWAYELALADSGHVPGWTLVGGPGAMFVVGPPTQGYGYTSRLYGLSPNRDSVWSYEGPLEWTKIGGPASEIWSTSQWPYATSPATGDIFRFDGVEWHGMGGSGFDIAVGASCGDIYGLSSDHKIWEHDEYGWSTLDGWVCGTRQNLRFDRIFAGPCLVPRAREKDTKALWSFEWDEHEPPCREPRDRGAERDPSR